VSEDARRTDFVLLEVAQGNTIGAGWLSVAGAKAQKFLSGVHGTTEVVPC